MKKKKAPVLFLFLAETSHPLNGGFVHECTVKHTDAILFPIFIFPLLLRMTLNCIK